MTTNKPLVSVVSPVYEEEEALPHFHAALAEVLDGLADKYDIEIIYVDDGSRDGTLPLLRRLAREDARVRYYSFSRNFGHQAALTAGMERARGDAVVTLDSDLQHPPALIPVLLRRWKEGNDVVVTIRAEDPTLGLFKRVSSKLFYALMGRFSDVEIRPAAADFRLMSRRAVESLLRLRETHRFLRGMVQWIGFPSAEVHFEPAARGPARPSTLCCGCSISASTACYRSRARRGGCRSTSVWRPARPARPTRAICSWRGWRRGGPWRRPT